jgi:hypothetical protein
MSNQESALPAAGEANSACSTDPEAAPEQMFVEIVGGCRICLGQRRAKERTMPRKIRTTRCRCHQTASEIVCPQCMRHSPAFDIVADARGRAQIAFLEWTGANHLRHQIRCASR